MRVDFSSLLAARLVRRPGFSGLALVATLPVLALLAAPAQAQTTADTIQSIQAQAQLAARDALKAPCDTDISEYVNKLWVYKRQLETLRDSLEKKKDDLNKKAIAKLKELSDLIPQFGSDPGEKSSEPGSPTAEMAKDPAKSIAVDAVKDVAKDAIKASVEKHMGAEIAKKAGEQIAGGAVEGIAKGFDAAKVAKELMQKMDIDIAREGIITEAVNLEMQIQLTQLYEDMAKAGVKAVEALIARLDTKEKCPPPSTASGIGTNPATIPITPGPKVATGLWGGTGGSIGVGGTDGPTWCGYGPGTPGLFPYLPMDTFIPPDPVQPAGGPTTTPGDTPKTPPPPDTPKTPPPPDTPKVAGGPPPTGTPGGDPKQPTTPPTPTGGTQPTETPKTPPPTDTPKTPPPTDTPKTQQTSTTPDPTPTTTPDPVPTGHIVIIVKATESVMQGGQPGNPLAGQSFALFTPKPALPVFNSIEFGPTGFDFGFNRDPARCTTGGNGGCNINVPQDERPMFGIPDTGNAFGMNVEPQKVNGGYLTGNGSVPDLTPYLPNGVTPVFGEPFGINGETYRPVFFNFPSNVPFDVSNLQSQFPNLQIDFCFDKQPGPPLGTEPKSFSALNQELPNASVTIERIRRTMRRTAR